MSNQVATSGGEASDFARAPIGHAAAALARECYAELKDIRAPKNMSMVPQITVTLTYRLESTK